MSDPRPAPQTDTYWTTTHAHYADWFRAHGYVQGSPASNFEIAWSTRIGYDSTTLEFWPWVNRAGVVCVDAIVGPHASGTNPRVVIGTCDSLAEVQEAHDLIRRLNGYQRPEPEALAASVPQETPQLERSARIKRMSEQADAVCARLERQEASQRALRDSSSPALDRSALEALIAEMREPGKRMSVEDGPVEFMDAVAACYVDEWADAIEACLRRPDPPPEEG